MQQWLAPLTVGSDRADNFPGSGAGELAYRLARPDCQAWNPAGDLPRDSWPAAAP